MTMPLQRGITYGPVGSRRLGRSLGINILPTNRKICTFNCVYCQYGWTRDADPGDVRNVQWPSRVSLYRAVEHALTELRPPAAYITFSGNGEPTLHPDFDRIVDGIIELRDKHSPSSRTAILSNSTRITNELIRSAVAKLDVRIMKLDAGNAGTFRRYNRPIGGIDLEQIAAGLREMNEMMIQALFAAGPAGNLGAADVDDWIEKIVRIAPVHVQVYTLDRPYPSEKIAPASVESLEGIKLKLAQRGVCAGVY